MGINNVMKNTFWAGFGVNLEADERPGKTEHCNW